MDHRRALATLGLGKDATSDEIKRAHRRLVKRHHPDVGGDEVRFLEIQAAYELLVLEASSPPSQHASSGSESGLSIGDWLIIRSLELDGRPVPGATRAQITVVDEEVFLSVHLNPPWPHSSERVAVVLSEDGSRGVVRYERLVVQRSSDRHGKLTDLWFSPFDRRMRIDGVPVGEEVVEEEPNPAFRRTRRPPWW